MNKIGIFLVSVGFLVGSLSTFLDTENVNWWLYALAVALGVGGIVLLSLRKWQKLQETERLSENIDKIESSLNNIVINITELNASKADINTYDVRHKIDEKFIEDLENFVESRKSIGQLFGLQAYADVMSSFAAAERYLNRVWSASADGYIDEVNMYLEKSAQTFSDSLEKLKAAKQLAPA